MRNNETLLNSKGYFFLFFFIVGNFLNISCRSVENRKQFIQNAQSYIGTPYLYGGTSNRGIDCSGLVYESFKKQAILIPRVSIEQANFFKEINYTKIREGDLVFFVTSGNYINHVGIVTKVTDKYNVEFLHASTSRGVRVDKLLTNYWSNRFVKVVRPNYKFNNYLTKSK